MNDSLISILRTIGALGLLIGIAYALDFKQRSQGQEQDQVDRRIFYVSLGLLFGGFMLLGIGGVYGSTLVAIIGIIMFFGSRIVRWIWKFRKARQK